jgi:glycosyltransferase involved in cell wall biosynthesis
MVVDSHSADPAELLVARLRHLHSAGWDARVFCRGEDLIEDPALRDPALRPSVQLARTRKRHRAPLSLLRRPSELARYLAADGKAGPFDGRLLRWRPDVVHFYSGRAGWKGIRLKRVVGCRAVISFLEDVRDLDVPDPQILWKEGDLLLFSSAATLERAVGLGGPRERAQVLTQPLEARDSPAPERRSRSGPLRILSVGPLTWEHGFEHSVHAVRLLIDMGIPCDYRIVGGGILYAVAFARHQLDLADHVHLIEPDGWDSAVRETRAADVVLDPAVADTVSPAPLLRAQALGVPFVATHRDGLPEDAGITVPRRDPRAIASALATLARDPGLRERMGEAGRRGPDAYPTLEEHLDRLEELYRNALG